MISIPGTNPLRFRKYISISFPHLLYGYLVHKAWSTSKGTAWLVTYAFLFTGYSSADPELCTDTR